MSSEMSLHNSMSKVLDEQHILPNQLLHYRSYIRPAFGDV